MAADFTLSDDELRAVARFAVVSAADVLPVFERVCPEDGRPRAAVDAAWVFVEGAPRSRVQRVTATEAHRAAREAPSEVARCAAQAAGDAAAAAYLHPIAKAHQVGHVLRATANAARVAELEAGGDPAAAEAVIDAACARAGAVLVDVLARYPLAPTGRSRQAQLVNLLDVRLRGLH